MPELPEIETMRRAVRPGIVGRTVTDVEVRSTSVIANTDPETFRGSLVGRVFDDLTRRGKYLTAQMDDGSRMVMHMRMTGCVVVAPCDRPEERHTHIVIRLDNGNELRFTDMRRFGRFWLFLEGEEDAISGISSLGPEPDDPALTADYLRRRLGSSRRPVKECLLDQTVVAGIGNNYTDEILFSCGMDPSRPACSIGDDEWESLSTMITRCMGFFTENNQVSPDEWLESQGREYRNTPLIRIYGHAGEPCPVCGTTLVKDRIGGRGSVHCPMCQR